MYPSENGPPLIYIWCRTFAGFFTQKVQIILSWDVILAKGFVMHSLFKVTGLVNQVCLVLLEVL